MNRLLLITVLLFASITLLYAGGAQEKASGGAPEGAVKVSMSSWTALQEVSRNMMLEIGKRFESTYPDIDIVFVDMPFEQRIQQTLVSVSGGNPPDIIHLTAKDPFQLAAMGALTDLMPWFKDRLDDIPEGALKTGVRADQLISVPLQLGTIVVLGMKENLKAVGLPDSIPDNWIDFKIAVKKISPNSAFWFFPVMYGHGGEFEDASGKVVFNSPGNIAALSWYKEIGTEKQTPMGMAIPESRNLFAQGSVGFLFDGPWMLPIMRNQSGKGEGIDPAYTAAPFPKGPDGRRRGINNNHVLVVSKQSKVKDQAVTFIKYWTQDPEITDFHYEKMGAIPAYKSLQARPTYNMLHDVTKAAIEGAEYAEGAPSKNPQFSAALEFVAAGLQAALLGGNPTDIAAQADLAIRTLYGQ
jgi:ABC-type glycerol-3-phosphate transport system substrate-binding protein